jgi:ribosomal protein L17
MKLVPIFDDDYCILSTKGDHEKYSEFDKIFRNWTDIEYLDNFFSTHEKDLKRTIWENISIEQAIIETRNEAIKFRKYLKKLIKKLPDERIPLLLRLFKSLSNDVVTNHLFEKKKAYVNRNKTWLRIYALKAGEDMYIITGGAIKLTATMEEREHTQAELRKLNTCRQFLISEGIVDDDGVIELLEI